MVAQHLNSFIRHADIVKMANMTMLFKPCGYSPEGASQERNLQGILALQQQLLRAYSLMSAPTAKIQQCCFRRNSHLDVTAVLNNEVLVINVVNRHETKAIETDIVLQIGRIRRYC